MSKPWIPWTGGPCPFENGTWVETITRGGEIESDDRPADWNWHHHFDETDIVGYRLIDPKPTYEQLEGRIKLLESALSAFVCNCGRHCEHLGNAETCPRKIARNLIDSKKIDKSP